MHEDWASKFSRQREQGVNFPRVYTHVRSPRDIAYLHLNTRTHGGQTAIRGRRWPANQRTSPTRHVRTHTQADWQREDILPLASSVGGVEAQEHIVVQSPGFPRSLESPRVVLAKFPGPGNAWNLLGSDADTDAKICAHTHLYNCKKMLEQFLCYFFTTCESDEHILQYACCYHTIYTGWQWRNFDASRLLSPSCR